MLKNIIGFSAVVILVTGCMVGPYDDYYDYDRPYYVPYPVDHGHPPPPRPSHGGHDAGHPGGGHSGGGHPDGGLHPGGGHPGGGGHHVGGGNGGLHPSGGHRQPR